MNSQLILQIVAYVLVGIVVILAAGVVLKSSKDKREREQMAAKRGWRVEPATERHILYRLSGTTADGLAWQLEATRRPSSSTTSTGGAARSTRWWTEAVKLTEDMVLVGPRQPAPPGLDLGGMLVQFFLRAILGEDAAGKIAQLKETSTGSETLREHYMVFASDETAAGRFLTGSTEALLIDWALQERKADRRPAVIFWDRGLQVKYQVAIADARTVERIIELGSALATEQKAH